MESQALENCLKTAKEAGCPSDQVENFLKKGYVPFPWQWEFHSGARQADKKDGPVDLGLGGARGPGKSHAVPSQVGLDDCQRVSGLKGLFLRQTGVSAKESFEDLIDKTLKGRISYTYASNVLRFENGSKVILGGFRDERDLDKYIGIEYDLIIIEELNQLSKERILKLKGSLRTSKENWRPRLYTSFNPGGKGHSWVKDRYVLPYKTALENETRFYPSTYKVNLFLNKEYIDYLEGLQGNLGKAWRDGEWDLFAGQYFTEWRTSIHTCKPFVIPFDWKHFCGLDYGYSAQASLGWYAIDPNGTLYRYKEFYGNKHTGSQLGEKFVQMTNPSEKIQYIVCDPSFWAKRGEDDNALSTAEKFENRIKEILKSISSNLSSPTISMPALIKGNNDRITGWLEIREWLKPFEKEGKLTAKLQVFSTCREFLRTFPALTHSINNPEDLETDSEDHGADELRYVIMSRPQPLETGEQKESRMFQEMIKKRGKQGNSRKLLFVNR